MNLFRCALPRRRNVSRNRFTGRLDGYACAFQLLQSLDAGHNALSGRLPAAWWSAAQPGLRNAQML